MFWNDYWKVILTHDFLSAKFSRVFNLFSTWNSKYLLFKHVSNSVNVNIHFKVIKKNQVILWGITASTWWKEHRLQDQKATSKLRSTIYCLWALTQLSVPQVPHERISTSQTSWLHNRSSVLVSWVNKWTISQYCLSHILLSCFPFSI